MTSHLAFRVRRISQTGCLGLRLSLRDCASPIQWFPSPLTRLSQHSHGLPWVALHRCRGCAPPTAGPSYAANVTVSAVGVPLVRLASHASRLAPGLLPHVRRVSCLSSRARPIISCQAHLMLLVSRQVHQVCFTSPLSNQSCYPQKMRIEKTVESVALPRRSKSLYSS